MKLKMIVLFTALLVPAAFAQTTQTRDNQPKQKKANHSAAGEYGGAAGDAGKGAAGGVGHAAVGAGKGAADFATLHPVKGTEDVGKGAGKGAYSVGKGAAKGTGKAIKGTGKILTHPF